MDWVQFAILFVTILGFFFTMRWDSKELSERWLKDREKWDRDLKEFNEKHETNMKEFGERWAADLKEFREKWAAESREFHGRLIAIEERRNKLLFKE